MTRSVFSQDYKRFLRLLIEIRKRQGLTQVEVAARLGKPQSFVSKYERGERRLDVIELLDVTDALEVHPYYIIANIMSHRRASGRTKQKSVRVGKK